MAPLVGRERELGTIRDALAARARGERRVVELVGEPGIGKSRLVEAALAEAAGLRADQGRGRPLRRALARTARCTRRCGS